MVFIYFLNKFPQVSKLVCGFFLFPVICIFNPIAGGGGIVCWFVPSAFRGLTSEFFSNCGRAQQQ